MTDTIRHPIPIPDSIAERRSNLIGYWNATATCDDLGGILGSLVRDTEVRVTELLSSGDPEDVEKADRLTAFFEISRRQYF